jgi:hypothetical protein
VKKGSNLYLTRETLETMKKRNAATGKRYRSLPNKVTRLVRRDKQDSNLLSLKKAKNDPKVLWCLADQALRKDRPSLPGSVNGVDGNPTATPLEAAEAMIRYFVDKVDALRKKVLLPRADAPDVSEEVPDVSEEVPDVTGEVPDNPQEVGNDPKEVCNDPQEVGDVQQEVDDNVTSRRHFPKFFFKFANAKRISKTIKGLNNTEALGMDGIPTSVLKKGVEVLARAILHLVNWSMAEVRVPASFKIGKVHPIHKGKGKPQEDPASYRPVSILPALSKVLESNVKGNLEDHLKKVKGLPGSQYGFRPKRSCTSSLAHAQAGWLSGAAKGQVVGLMALDLSAAFDTVAAKQLAPTLQAIGVTGRELKWFLCYMSGGKQGVVWEGMVSSLTNILYGVRQGSILGPILFIILLSGMAAYLGVRDGENVVYADDSNVWQMGRNVEKVVRKLREKASLSVDYTRSMGLSMNASKTQLLFFGDAGYVADVTVEVDGSTIKPSNNIKLLGVGYDRKLLTTPHVPLLLAAVRQRALIVAWLANHLPMGTYLRQLSYGLVMGKFAHALAAVARPRLDSKDTASGIGRKIQVALNDVARSITGIRRRDHITIKDLLDLAGIESANRMVVKAVAAEAWMCYHSNNGQDGARNHVGSILFADNKNATAKTTRSARTDQITFPLGGGTPSSRTWPMCETGRARYATRPQRWQQRRRHQILQITHHFSRDLLPAKLDLPPAARGVFPAGLGASPAGRGASPREHGPSPSRSWALPPPFSSPLFSGFYHALSFSLSSSSGRKLGAYKRFREVGDKHCVLEGRAKQRAMQSKVRTL